MADDDATVASTPSATSTVLVATPGRKLWWKQKRLWFAVAGVVFAVWGAWKRGAQSVGDFLGDDGVMNAVLAIGAVLGFVGAYAATVKGSMGTAATKAAERQPSVASVDVKPVGPADEPKS